MIALLPFDLTMSPEPFPTDPMQCPSCRGEYDYVHPMSVEVNRGGEITRVDSHGTHMEAGEASGRGVRITVHFGCESGHAVELVFQFHKGNTFVTFSAAEPDEPEWWPTTLWRD